MSVSLYGTLDSFINLQGKSPDKSPELSIRSSIKNPRDRRVKEFVNNLIVEANLSQNGFIYAPSFDEVQTEKVVSINRWTLLREAWDETKKQHLDRSAVRGIITIAALSVLCITLSIGSLYFGMRIQKYFSSKIGSFLNINYYSNGSYLYTQYNVEYLKSNYYRDMFTTIPLLLLSTVGSAIYLGIVIFEKIKANPLYKNYEKILKEFSKGRYIHRIKCTQSSISTGTPDNCESKTTYFDPITQENMENVIIPLNGKSCYQKSIPFDKNIVNLQSVLSAMFNRTFMFAGSLDSTSLKEGQIPHPWENRFLGGEQANEFLNNIALIFGITDQQKISDCWKGTRIEIAKEYCKRNNENWEYFSDERQFRMLSLHIDDAVGKERLSRFLDLLPENVRKYFPDLNLEGL